VAAHARFLQLQGQDSKDVDLIGTNQKEKSNISPKEQVLLDYVKILTLNPADLRDKDTERVRKAGWTDPEIFEASFTTSLFAFFNRMADAYALDYNPNYWLPPELRTPTYNPQGGAPNTPPKPVPTGSGTPQNKP
jgi:alkylhydroperoxidase family enzyme